VGAKKTLVKYSISTRDIAINPSGQSPCAFLEQIKLVRKISLSEQGNGMVE